jgi:hypothetical protein
MRAILYLALACLYFSLQSVCSAQSEPCDTLGDKRSSPDIIVSDTIANYSSCLAYTDEGVVVVHSQSGDEHARRNHKFTIDFKRNEYLRFRFGIPPVQFGLDANQNQVIEYVFGVATTLPNEQVTKALTNLSSETHLASESVPLMLVSSNKSQSNFVVPRAGWQFATPALSEEYYELKWEDVSRTTFMRISKESLCIQQIIFAPTESEFPKIELRFQPTVFEQLNRKEKASGTD